MTRGSQPYEDWLRFVFEHPERDDGKSWFDLDITSKSEFRARVEQEVRWESDKERLLSWLTRTCRDAGAILPRFTPRQAAEGLWYLLGESRSFHAVLRPGRGPSPPWTARRECIRSTYRLFADYFAPPGAWREAAASVLRHWWEEFPLPKPFYREVKPGPLPPESQAYYDEVLAVLEGILRLDDPACRASAYFQLARWDEPTGKAAKLKAAVKRRPPL